MLYIDTENCCYFLATPFIYIICTRAYNFISFATYNVFFNNSFIVQYLQTITKITIVCTSGAL